METDKEYAIRLAMEYGFTSGFDALDNLTFDVTVVEAILEAIQHEREEIAKLIEPDTEHRKHPYEYLGGEEGVLLLDEIAKTVRVRGQK